MYSKKNLVSRASFLIEGAKRPPYPAITYCYLILLSLYPIMPVSRTAKSAGQKSWSKAPKSLGKIHAGKIKQESSVSAYDESENDENYMDKDKDEDDEDYENDEGDKDDEDEEGSDEDEVDGDEDEDESDEDEEDSDKGEDEGDYVDNGDHVTDSEVDEPTFDKPPQPGYRTEKCGKIYHDLKNG